MMALQLPLDNDAREIILLVALVIAVVAVIGCEIIDHRRKDR